MKEWASFKWTSGSLTDCSCKSVGVVLSINWWTVVSNLHQQSRATSSAHTVENTECWSHFAPLSLSFSSWTFCWISVCPVADVRWYDRMVMALRLGYATNLKTDHICCWWGHVRHINPHTGYYFLSKWQSSKNKSDSFQSTHIHLSPLCFRNKL